jgi:4-aminobutyrate aminotransferase-like enzyme
LVEQALHSVLKNHKIGAILVEPIQVRGGINVPPRWFLPFLRALCYRYHILLIVDEIYTGFGRTGKWFACEHGGVIPDMICLGKALAGGFPLSACVGRTDLMDVAWPVSTGEAIHTSTFLGNPLGCAMALAQLTELERRQLVRHSSELGRFLVGALASLKPVASGLKFAARGLGLLAGIELRKPDGAPATEAAMRIIKSLLHRGFIVLPEGEHSNVISLSPPLTISKPQLQTVVDALEQELTTS